MSDMKDLRIVMRVRNNQLQERREKLGLTPRQLAELIGIQYGTYLQLEGMTLSPLTHPPGGSHGSPKPLVWRAIVKKLAAHYGILPADLFPDSVVLIRKTKAEVRCNAEEIALALAPPASTAPSPLQLIESAEVVVGIEAALSTLDDREQEVIRRRYGLDGEAETLDQIADLPYADGSGSVTRERVRQIEMKALRKLRHPARKLREIVLGLSNEEIEATSRRAIAAKKGNGLTAEEQLLLAGTAEMHRKGLELLQARTGLNRPDAEAFIRQWRQRQANDVALQELKERRL
jgi:transcriptional regulator with XRE-family HTH domain